MPSDHPLLTEVVRTMCFSLVASVTAGSALTAAGVGTVTLTRRRAELPLALIPLLFGVQQLTEGAVWWSLDHHDPALNVTTTVAYTLFALVLWPVWVPLAVRLLEPGPRRRAVLGGALALGVVVGLDGLRTVLRGPRTSHVVGHCIAYAPPSPVLVAAYLVVTCGGAMVSSRAFLRLMGAAPLVLALVALWLYAAVFVSVWCFFSAVLTVAVAGHFWSLHGPRSRAVATPAVGPERVSG